MKNNKPNNQEDNRKNYKKSTPDQDNTVPNNISTHKTQTHNEKLEEQSIIHYYTERPKSEKIFSFKLGLLAIFILIILLFVGIIAEFLQQRNPISSLLKLTEINFTIDIFEARNVRLIRYSSETEEQVPIDRASPMLFEAIVALHGTLEKKVNPRAVEVNVTRNKEYSDLKKRLEEGELINITNNLSSQNINYQYDHVSKGYKNYYFILDNHLKYISNDSSLHQEGITLLQELTNNITDHNLQLNTEQLGDLTTAISSPSDDVSYSSSIDMKTKEENFSKIRTRLKQYFSGTVCPIYTSFREFSNYDCMYSYPNFILNNLTSSTEEVDSWAAKIINSSKALKNYLLLDWIKTNIDIPKFFTMYFNTVSYGTYIIGLNSAAERFFNTSISELNVSQSVFLAKLIYDQNKNIYPNDVEISYLDIYQRLVTNGIIASEDIDSLLHETLSYNMSNERRHNVKYLSTLFNEGYKYYHKSNQVNIKTTFDNYIQNSSSQILFNTLKQSAYRNATIMILKQNNIIASYTMGINKKGEPVFTPDDPKVYSFSGIKPLIYLTALNNKNDISQVLLESKYQSLINTYARRIDFYKMHKELSSINKNHSINLSALTFSDLDIAPPKLRNLFAKELYNLERSYLSSVPITDYRNTLNQLGIDTTGITSLQSLLDGQAEFNFTDIVRAYSAFQNDDHTVRNPRFISHINNEPYHQEDPAIAQINVHYIKLMKNLMLNKLKTLPNNKVIYALYDKDTAYAFYDDYTIGIWIGNLSQQGTDYNSQAYELVKSTLETITNLLY